MLAVLVGVHISYESIEGIIKQDTHDYEPEQTAILNTLQIEVPACTAGTINHHGESNRMNNQQLERVRRISSALPDTTERLSHGEPTFFVNNKVFVMFANNHHNDGRIAVWLPVPDGFQATLIGTAPETYFKPPYVGARGWVGIRLDRISDRDLTFHIQTAWELVVPKRTLSRVRAGTDAAKPPESGMASEPLSGIIHKTAFQ